MFGVIKRLLKNRRDSTPCQTFSQEGEDMVLKRIFENKLNGFYVDVGAHHPSRFSNTLKFYQIGWTGINIEPNPDAHHLFLNKRPNDINLNIGISNNANDVGTLKYYMFDEPALNTFDPLVLQSRLNDTPYNLVRELNVSVLSLKEVFNKYIHSAMAIDFMTIDVEGLDFEVLQSNDWNRYRPAWVLVEQLGLQDLEKLDFEIHHFMKSVNYILFAKTYNTLFYKNLSA